MPRPLWKGALSFGLVSIPVELQTAVRAGGPKFRLLRGRDRSPIRYQRIAERDEQIVDWKDLVKGYEYAKGRFVVLTKDELEDAALDRDETITILDFVEDDTIDDRFFAKPYYLTAGRGGDKAYALLRETIRQTGRIGVATFVMRNKQHLAAIEAIGKALVLTMMRFADDLVDITAYDFPTDKGLRKQDLDVAKLLVDNLTAKWDPARYTDEYRQNLMKIIEAKRKGQEARLEEPQPRRSAQVVDLMERLRASLEGTGTARKRAPERKRKTVKARKKASGKAA